MRLLGRRGVTSSEIPDGTITNADLATMAARTIKGNATASTAAPQDIASSADVMTLLQCANNAAILTAIGAMPIAGGNFTGDVDFRGTLTDFWTSGGAHKTRWFETAGNNHHGLRNVSNVFTWDYNGTDYLEIDALGQLRFTIDLVSGNIFKLVQTNAGANGAFLSTYHNSASPAASDFFGGLQMYANTSTTSEVFMAGIYGLMTDATHATRASRLEFWNAAAGAAAAQRMLLTAAALTPASAGGLTLGSASLSFGASFFIGDMLVSNNSATAARFVGNNFEIRIITNGGSSGYRCDFGGDNTGVYWNTNSASRGYRWLMNSAGGFALDTSSNLVPNTNDVGALGTTSLRWGDVRLASGAVVDFNNDILLTHSTDLLTLSGGGLTLSGGNVTIGEGSLSVTGGNAAVVPATFSPTSASYTGASWQSIVTRAGSSAYNFFIGYSNAAGDIEFKLSGDGNGTCDGAWTGGGADYAEYFEWDDGNPLDEDRRGYSVALVGEKIRIAREGDEPIGIVSSNPTVVGDAAAMKWQGKHLRDQFGSYVFEEYEVHEWEENLAPKKTVVESIVDAAKAVGRFFASPFVEPAEPKTPEEPQIIKHSYMHDQIPAGVIPPITARLITHDENGTRLMRRKLNPDFDPSVEYKNREQRKEWSPIGLTGKIAMRKGQVVDPRWRKLNDINENVERWLVR